MQIIHFSVLQESLLWLFQSRLPLATDTRIEFNTFATVFFPRMSGSSFVRLNSLTNSVLCLCCRTCTSTPRCPRARPCESCRGCAVQLHLVPHSSLEQTGDTVVMNNVAMDGISRRNLDIERSTHFNLKHALAQIIPSIGRSSSNGTLSVVVIVIQTILAAYLGIHFMLGSYTMIVSGNLVAFDLGDRLLHARLRVQAPYCLHSSC